jgi:asparagine synthase (glutamine-hydrolysing)
MCGLVGILNRSGAPVDPALLDKMTRAMIHRGPDDQGLHLFSLQHGQSQPRRLNGQSTRPTAAFEGGLGFARLSILDLSEAGHQPMASADGRVILAFNGEIYNAFDYQPELKAAGCVFRSKTDTEVILHLYQIYGWEGMLERLNGMFAICIVDLDRQCVLLARDRMGIKPLYWYDDNGVLLFGSEVKSFLEHPAFQPELDPQLLDEQFIFRYCSGAGFPLRGVRQVEPGCALRIDARGDTLTRYWSIPERQMPGSRGTSLSPAKAADSVESELRQSVARRLLSDVKLGCQLSGGIDSSLVSLFAADSAGSDIDAISIIFEDALFSEQSWIEQAAARGGIRAHQFTLDADYFFEALPAAVWHLDQPLNHPNSIGIYKIGQEAKPIMTVLLSGEGADELMGGYGRFSSAALLGRAQPLLRQLRPLSSVFERLGRAWGHPLLDPVDWMITRSAFMKPELLRQVRPNADIGAVLARRRTIFDEGQGDYLANCLRYEQRTYLVDILIRQDKMTMAHSIETRVPFLDHQLVEFMRQLPSDNLIAPSLDIASWSARSSKRPLKQVASKYFGDKFVYRRKAGFALPLRAYFQDPRFIAMMQDALLPGMRERGVVEYGAVERWWKAVDDAPNAWLEALWISISFELWAQRFVDRRAAIAV